MLTLPKQPISWINVIQACLFMAIFMPIWAQVMSMPLALLTGTASATFTVYMWTELCYAIDKWRYRKWMAEHKEEIEQLEKVLNSLYIQMKDTQDKGDNNGNDINRCTGARNLRKEATSEDSEEAK